MKMSADVFTRTKRRQIMQAVRREDTRPELLLAKALRRAGVSFLRHPPHLPGRPDLYLPDARLAVFVHGCFWHGHEKCRKGRQRPKSNRRYWEEKIERNKRRDRRVARRLRAEALSVFTIWECELRSGRVPCRLIARLRNRRAPLPSPT